MADRQFEYFAQRFHPRETADQSLLMFISPASDILSWAGVPRKAFDYQHGFQRTLNPSRVKDVAGYFLEDSKNISPTAIVVGFTGTVVVEDINMPQAGVPKVDAARVRITVPDFEHTPLEELTALAMTELRSRLPENVVAEIENDAAAAVAEAMRLQDESAIDEEFGIESEVSGDGAVEESERSYLADFYAQLFGYTHRLLPWPEADSLREILYSLLKPAIIVDGQHRVFGAASVDRNMLLAVCAIPNSNWVESVYQFVIINQKAKPIKPAFLSSIIATSLSTDEIASVYQRLSKSRIDVDGAEVMDRVNTDPRSPFKDMIDFEVEGSPGFLQFPGMSRLARDFRNLPQTRGVLLKDGVWKDKEEWLSHFFSAWSGIRRYFLGADPRLWKEPSEDNPNNLLKIVTLQEMQSLMLNTWADSRAFRFGSPVETEEQAFRFWEDFPSNFFTDDWRKKGLQTSVGRGILRDAITETRRNIGRKGWGHRRLALFLD
jgi:hypothetical protein